MVCWKVLGFAVKDFPTVCSTLISSIGKISDIIPLGTLRESKKVHEFFIPPSSTTIMHSSLTVAIIIIELASQRWSFWHTKCIVCAGILRYLSLQKLVPLNFTREERWKWKDCGNSFSPTKAHTIYSYFTRTSKTRITKAIFPLLWMVWPFL